MPDEGLDIRYLDGDLLVVDKPTGLLTVPGRGPGKRDCLSARVQARYPEALPVHRLDLGTSGLLVLARGPEMHRASTGCSRRAGWKSATWRWSPDAWRRASR